MEIEALYHGMDARRGEIRYDVQTGLPHSQSVLSLILAERWHLVKMTSCPVMPWQVEYLVPGMDFAIQVSEVLLEERGWWERLGRLLDCERGYWKKGCALVLARDADL